jgi:hypothetical protein
MVYPKSNIEGRCIMIKELQSIRACLFIAALFSAGGARTLIPYECQSNSKVFNLKDQTQPQPKDSGFTLVIGNYTQNIIGCSEKMDTIHYGYRLQAMVYRGSRRPAADLQDNMPFLDTSLATEKREVDESGAYSCWNWSRTVSDTAIIHSVICDGPSYVYPDRQATRIKELTEDLFFLGGREAIFRGIRIDTILVHVS